MSERNIVEELYVTRRRPKFSVEFNLKNSEEIWKKINIMLLDFLHYNFKYNFPRQHLSNILLKNS